MSEDSNSSKFSRDLLFTLLSRAGKSKDEVVEILGREIGQAIAAMLKRPLNDVFKHNKIQLTIELVPKSKAKNSKIKN